MFPNEDVHKLADTRYVTSKCWIKSPSLSLIVRTGRRQYLEEHRLKVGDRQVGTHVAFDLQSFPEQLMSQIIGRPFITRS